MDCDCYKIGGPFIEEDPNCPVHGSGGVRDLEEKIDCLRQEVAELREQIRLLKKEAHERKE